MKDAVGDGSSHAVQSAAVVVPVPKVEDGQNDQRGHEDTHIISPFASIFDGT